MTVTIRSAHESDIPSLTTLLRNSWLTAWAPELQFATVQRFVATDPAGGYARDKWREFIVADDDGALLGMYHIEGDHLHAIHLSAKHKRRGIGTLLMDDVERRIAATHREASLEVLAFNTAAIAFYEQRGWQRRRVYQGDECGEAVETIEMVKAL